MMIPKYCLSLVIDRNTSIDQEQVGNQRTTGSVYNRKPKNSSLSYAVSLPNHMRKNTQSETNNMRQKSSSESSTESRKKKIVSINGDVFNTLKSENKKLNNGGNVFLNMYSPLPC